MFTIRERRQRHVRPPTVPSTTHSPSEGSITHGDSVVPQGSEGAGDDDSEGDDEGSETGDGSEGVGIGDADGVDSCSCRSRLTETEDEPAGSEDQADDAGCAVPAHDAEAGTSNTKKPQKIAHPRLRARDTG